MNIQVKRKDYEAYSKSSKDSILAWKRCPEGDEIDIYEAGTQNHVVAEVTSVKKAGSKWRHKLKIVAVYEID